MNGGMIDRRQFLEGLSALVAGVAIIPQDIMAEDEIIEAERQIDLDKPVTSDAPLGTIVLDGEDFPLMEFMAEQRRLDIYSQGMPTWTESIPREWEVTCCVIGVAGSDQFNSGSMVEMSVNPRDVEGQFSGKCYITEIVMSSEWGRDTTELTLVGNGALTHRT